MKTEFLRIGNFWLRVIGRQEIKDDVWKYIRPVLMGLGAILEKKLDNQDRALRQGQMSPSNPNPFKRGSNRGISLSGHCTGKSALAPTLPSKCGMRATTARNVSECADVKWSAKIEKGVRRGRDPTSSLLVFRTSSQRGLCKYCEKVSGESHFIQEPHQMGGHTSENRGVRTYTYIHITYILPNASRQWVSRNTILCTNVNLPKNKSNPKLPYKGSSRGGTIELL